MKERKRINLIRRPSRLIKVYFILSAANDLEVIYCRVDTATLCVSLRDDKIDVSCQQIAISCFFISFICQSVLLPI